MRIPHDKVVLVTGAPRSGTSLAMQTLALLGVPVAGERFPAVEGDALADDVPDAGAADLRALNPGGFYEVPGVVMRGLREIGRYGGQAIKILSSGAWPRAVDGEQLGTPVELVHRYLLCVRDPRSVAASQSRLPGAGGRGEITVAESESWRQPDWPSDPHRLLIENGALARFLAGQFGKGVGKGVRNRLPERPCGCFAQSVPDPFSNTFSKSGYLGLWLMVDYDRFLKAPAETIERICCHLQIEPAPSQRVAAVANVDQSLRHWAGEKVSGTDCRNGPAGASHNRFRTPFLGWPERLQSAGQLAERLHAALSSLEPGELGAAADGVEAYLSLRRLESARWYDDGYGVVMSAALARSLACKPPLRDSLRASYRRSILDGFQHQSAANYAEPPDAPQYTIERPADLGNLTRAMVRYGGELMTRERAHALHTQRAIGGEMQVVDLAARETLARALLGEIQEALPEGDLLGVGAQHEPEASARDLWGRKLPR